MTKKETKTIPFYIEDFGDLIITYYETIEISPKSYVDTFGGLYLEDDSDWDIEIKDVELSFDGIVYSIFKCLDKGAIEKIKEKLYSL